MKRFYSILLLIFASVFLFQCKRPDIVVPVFFTDCFSQSFKQNTSSSLPVIDFAITAENYMVAMQQDGNSIVLQTLDSHGRQISSRSFAMPVSARLMNFLPMDDGGFVVSGAGNNFADSSIFINQNMTILSTGSTPCGKYYYDGLVSYIPHQTNHSETWLMRFDSNGVVQWSHNFPGNYYYGHSISINEGKILLLTHRADLTYRIIPGTVALDTMVANLNDKNKLDLFCLDASGNTIWSHEFTDISNQYNSSVYNFSASLQADPSHILVQSGYKALLLNLSGQQISENNMMQDICANSGGGMVLMLNTSLGEDHYVVIGPVSSFGGYSFVAFIYDFNHQLINHFNDQNFSSGTQFISLCSNGDGTYASFDGRVLTKFNQQGIIFSKNLQASLFSSDFKPSIRNTCDGGFYLNPAEVNSSGTIITNKIIKTDNNGNL